MNDIQLMILGAVAFNKAAKEFLRADRTDVGGHFLWNAFYYNVCISFELSLKAYLAHSGSNRTELKEVGHDLITGLEKATEKGFTPHSENLLPILQMLGPLYHSHELRYLKNKALTLPYSDEYTLELLTNHVTAIAIQVGLDENYARS